MQSIGDIDLEPSDGISTSISFTINNPYISVAIIGTKNPEHLIENINQVNKNSPLAESVLMELHKRFDDLDDNWVQQT